MPVAITDARKLMDGKVSIPGEMRTAEWARVGQWVRERAFYMAGVKNAEILQEFRKEAGMIAQGESSLVESERRLAEMLKAVGYTPEPGQEGTIKDLRFWKRMRVALRTNVELLQGWGEKERGRSRGAMMGYPCWELVRLLPKKVQRDWQARWVSCGGALTEGRMIALKTDPIWDELGNSFEDSLGVDYPPFAWGSGMGWRVVSFLEAERMGLIPADWSPPPREPLASPNEQLALVPKVSEPALREALAEQMRGLAEWDGDQFIFTDPNGSRPLSGEKLLGVW